MMTLASMRVLTPAKVNLHLRVGPRRDDGFHPLLTWMVTVGLFDKFRFERVRGDRGVVLRCDQDGLDVGESNLVVRAARALAGEAASGALPSGLRREVDGVSIALEKEIPIGAGLGGGSSDAACTLLSLNRLWTLQLPVNRLSELAAGLGSDVPFFLYPPSAVCRGRGEAIQPLPCPGKVRGILLILPRAMHMPTPAVYRRFDEMGLGTDLQTSEQPFQSWVTLDPLSLLQQLVNDLEPPAFSIRPELGRMRADAEQTLARPVRMSGSGSSLFTLYASPSEAEAAAQKLGASIAGVEVRVIATELAPHITDDLPRS
jgi:4-diphosphocytidyl-2-C-methyl-D-erythritol kinase